MRTTDRRNNDHLSSTLVGAVAMALAIIVIVGASLRLADALSPGTGDMINFVPPETGVVTGQASLIVARVGQVPVAFCALDPGVMRQSGGSLVIEAVASNAARRYRVHWAGVRTSESAADCGPAADLVLTPNDFAMLSFAATAPAETVAAHYNRPGMGRRTR
ncbi:MAG TPA: hypothetical protein VMB73_28495 [Acetobacteraceae bacterium]|jgi:hypothetical protein|nr:hypothetical protein [Acetobacteraceae bacterium]